MSPTQQSPYQGILFVWYPQIKSIVTLFSILYILYLKVSCTNRRNFYIVPFLYIMQLGDPPRQRDCQAIATQANTNIKSHDNKKNNHTGINIK